MSGGSQPCRRLRYYNRLSFSLRGNPRPEITWNVRGKIIRGAADEKYQIMDNGSLRIRNVGQADKGTYKCKATQMEDGITDFRDMVIQLKVQRKSSAVNFKGGNLF